MCTSISNTQCDTLKTHTQKKTKQEIKEVLININKNDLHQML